MTTEEQIQRLKDEGNEKFKAGQYQAALDAYSQALKLEPTDKNLKATLYKNRAAVYLKTKDYGLAEGDASKGV